MTVKMFESVLSWLIFIKKSAPRKLAVVLLNPLLFARELAEN